MCQCANVLINIRHQTPTKNMQTGNILLDKSFQFALDIIKFTSILEDKKKFVIANQLMRCGTSIGANVHEAQNPESRADFIHKLKIAAKEADETEYWLLLCKFAESYPFQEEILENLQDIKRIINKIINTAKSNA